MSSLAGLMRFLRIANASSAAELKADHSKVKRCLLLGHRSVQKISIANEFAAVQNLLHLASKRIAAIAHADAPVEMSPKSPAPE